MDALIIAVENLEVAIDDYTHGVFVNVTNPDPEDVPVSVLKAAGVKAAVEFAGAMIDAGVSFDVAIKLQAAVDQMPKELRAPAADAERAMVRAIRAA